jgi:hypothetical protein
MAGCPVVVAAARQKILNTLSKIRRYMAKKEKKDKKPTKSTGYDETCY